jgi:hypothetical protein
MPLHIKTTRLRSLSSRLSGLGGLGRSGDPVDVEMSGSPAMDSALGGENDALASVLYLFLCPTVRAIVQL